MTEQVLFAGRVRAVFVEYLSSTNGVQQKPILKIMNKATKRPPEQRKKFF
jgi:hypothetical protein